MALALATALHSAIPASSSFTAAASAAATASTESTGIAITAPALRINSADAFSFSPLIDIFKSASGVAGSGASRGILSSCTTAGSTTTATSTETRDDLPLDAPNTLNSTSCVFFSEQHDFHQLLGAPGSSATPGLPFLLAALPLSITPAAQRLEHSRCIHSWNDGNYKDYFNGSISNDGTSRGSNRSSCRSIGGGCGSFDDSKGDNGSRQGPSFRLRVVGARSNRYSDADTLICMSNTGINSRSFRKRRTIGGFCILRSEGDITRWYASEQPQERLQQELEKEVSWQLRDVAYQQPWHIFRNAVVHNRERLFTFKSASLTDEKEDIMPVAVSFSAIAPPPLSAALNSGASDISGADDGGDAFDFPAASLSSIFRPNVFKRHDSRSVSSSSVGTAGRPQLLLQESRAEKLAADAAESVDVEAITRVDHVSSAAKEATATLDTAVMETTLLDVPVNLSKCVVLTLQTLLCTRTRWHYLFFLSFYCYLIGPLYLNWAPLREFLFRSGVYAWECDPQELDPKSFRYLQPLTAAVAAAADKQQKHESVRTCVLQRLLVARLYTICAASDFGFSFFGGLVVDWLGPKVGALVGSSCLLMGWLLLAIASKDIPVYLPGMALFGIGIDMAFYGTLSVPKLFPGRENTVMALIVGMRGVSLMTPLLLNYISLPYLAIMLGFALLGFLPALFIASVYVPWKPFTGLAMQKGRGRNRYRKRFFPPAAIAAGASRQTSSCGSSAAAAATNTPDDASAAAALKADIVDVAATPLLLFSEGQNDEGKGWKVENLEDIEMKQKQLLQQHMSLQQGQEQVHFKDGENFWASIEAEDVTQTMLLPPQKSEHEREDSGKNQVQTAPQAGDWQPEQSRQIGRQLETVERIHNNTPKQRDGVGEVVAVLGSIVDNKTRSLSNGELEKASIGGGTCSSSSGSALLLRCGEGAQSSCSTREELQAPRQMENVTIDMVNNSSIFNCDSPSLAGPEKRRQTSSTTQADEATEAIASVTLAGDAMIMRKDDAAAVAAGLSTVESTKNEERISKRMWLGSYPDGEGRQSTAHLTVAEGSAEISGRLGNCHRSFVDNTTATAVKAGELTCHFTHIVTRRQFPATFRGSIDFVVAYVKAHPLTKNARNFVTNYLFSMLYFPVIPYFTISLVRAVYFNDVSEDVIPAALPALHVMLGCVVFVLPLAGLVTDAFGTTFCLLMVNTFGTILVLTTLLAVVCHSVAFQYVAGISCMMYAALMTNQVYFFVADVFPARHLGKLCGLACSVAGVVSLCVGPMFEFSVKTRNGFVIMLCVLLALSGVCYFLIAVLAYARRRFIRVAAAATVVGLPVVGLAVADTCVDANPNVSVNCIGASYAANRTATDATAHDGQREEVMKT